MPRCRWLLLALLLGSLGLGCRRELSFSLTFRDANGLRPGQFLVYHGVRAGEVMSVDLDSGGQVVVGVRVFPEFRRSVYAEAAFSIQKPGGWLDISGERQITMLDHPGRRTPIRPGALIAGQDSMFAALFDGATVAARDAWARIIAAGRAMADEFSRTPAGHDIAKAMRDFTEKTGRVTSQAGANLEELKKQAEAFRDQLAQQGRKAEADEFWRGFETWYEGARAAASASTGPSTTPAGQGSER